MKRLMTSRQSESLLMPASIGFLLRHCSRKISGRLVMQHLSCDLGYLYDSTRNSRRTVRRGKDRKTFKDIKLGALWSDEFGTLSN